MCSPVSDSGCPIYCCGTISVLAVSMITFLVVGILGSPAVGVIPMSPLGCYCLLAIGSGILMGFVATAAKVCCNVDVKFRNW